MSGGGCIFQAHEKRVPCQSCLLIEMSYFLAAISLLALFLAYIVIFSTFVFVPIFWENIQNTIILTTKKLWYASHVTRHIINILSTQAFHYVVNKFHVVYLLEQIFFTLKLKKVCKGPSQNMLKVRIFWLGRPTQPYRVKNSMCLFCVSEQSKSFKQNKIKIQVRILSPHTPGGKFFFEMVSK